MWGHSTAQAVENHKEKHSEKTLLWDKFPFLFFIFLNTFISLDIVPYSQNIMVKLLLIVSECFFSQDPGNISTRCFRIKNSLMLSE